jgi:hypothetical protein
VDSLNWKHPLLVLKITLFVILAGLLVVGRSSSAWPIVNWTMYSSKTNLFPPATWQQSQIRVRSASDDRIWDLWPWNLSNRELSWMVGATMKGVAEQPDSRWRRESVAYLDGLIRCALPDVDA